MTQSALKPQKKTIPETKIANPKAKSVRNPSHEEITARARFLWEAQGRAAGRDEEFWLEAEAQLKKGQ